MFSAVMICAFLNRRSGHLLLGFEDDRELPDGITEVDLKRPHASKPRNPLIADVCFKAGYIDSWGRGNIRILEDCDEFDLPEPEMTEFQGGFKVTLYKDNYSEEQLKKLGLNERQMKAVKFVKEHTQITNTEYQNLFNVSRNTASRDLNELVEKNVLKSSDLKGAGSYYEF